MAPTVLHHWLGNNNTNYITNSFRLVREGCDGSDVILPFTEEGDGSSPSLLLLRNGVFCWLSMLVDGQLNATPSMQKCCW